MEIRLQRMWVNQPSTHQKWHKLHGALVLAAEPMDGMTDIWFTSGTTVKQYIEWSALSNGWVHQKVTTEEGHDFYNFVTDDDCNFRGQGEVTTALQKFLDKRNQ